MRYRYANAEYSLYRRRDQTGVVTNRGSWWGKKELVKVRVAENYWVLIPVRHRPSCSRLRRRLSSYPYGWQKFGEVDRMVYQVPQKPPLFFSPQEFQWPTNSITHQLQYPRQQRSRKCPRYSVIISALYTRPTLTLLLTLLMAGLIS